MKTPTKCPESSQPGPIKAGEHEEQFKKLSHHLALAIPMLHPKQCVKVQFPLTPSRTVCFVEFLFKFFRNESEGRQGISWSRLVLVGCMHNMEKLSSSKP